MPDNAPARWSARRFHRISGYKVSQVVRKGIEKIFSWAKIIGGPRRARLNGRTETWNGGYYVMAAYAPNRMARLLRPTPA